MNFWSNLPHVGPDPLTERNYMETMGTVTYVKCLNGYLFDRHVPFPMDMSFVVHVNATFFHSLIAPTF